MGQFTIQTERGYELLEVLSALQKEIRRGNEEEAGYWAFECWPKYQRVLWERLQVIATEDIGMADPQAALYVDCQKRTFGEMAKKGKEGPQRLCVAATVLYLCRAPKSRLTAHFSTYLYQRRIQTEWRLEIPDYALDKHTRRGRQKGRSWDHFKAEGAKLVNEAALYDPYKEKAQVLWYTSKKKKVTTKPDQRDGASLYDDLDPEAQTEDL